MEYMSMGNPEVQQVSENELLSNKLKALGMETEAFVSVKELRPEDPESKLRGVHVVLEKGSVVDGPDLLKKLGMLDESGNLSEEKMVQVMEGTSFIVIDNCTLDRSKLKDKYRLTSVSQHAQMLHEDREFITNGVGALYSPEVGEGKYKRFSSTYVANGFEYAQTLYRTVKKTLEDNPEPVVGEDPYRDLRKYYNNAEEGIQFSSLAISNNEYLGTRERIGREKPEGFPDEQAEKILDLYIWLHEQKGKSYSDKIQEMWDTALKNHKSKSIRIEWQGNRLVIYNNNLKGSSIVHGRGSLSPEEMKKQIEYISAGLDEQSGMTLELSDVRYNYSNF